MKAAGPDQRRWQQSGLPNRLPASEGRDYQHLRQVGRTQLVEQGFQHVTK